MRRKIIGIFVCMLMILTSVVPVTGMIRKNVNLFNSIFGNQTDMKYVPGEVIVKLKNDTTFSRFSLMSLNGMGQVTAVEKVFPNAKGTILDNIYLVHVPINSDILSLVQEYSLCPDVVYAEPDWIGECYGIPNDANFSSQWYLHNTGQVFLVRNRIMKISGTSDADIDAPEVWTIETGNSNVLIAIIDSGIDYTHPDLAANIWKNADEIPENGIDDDQNGYIDDVRGWDFSLNNSDSTDEFGHGTMCAGVAAAVANNNIGIAGICWNCKLMPVKINLTIFTMKTASQAIKYAADNGADICSMSFGIPFSFSLKNAIDYAYEKGVFLCAAAGNNNNDKKKYPAAYQHVVAVAATNQYDERCTSKDWGTGGSQYGEWIDIAAPGSLIYSTMPTYHVFMNEYRNHYTKQKYSQEYDWFSGTSSAAPAIAGIAALLLSIDSSLTPDEVKILLCKNVDPYNSKKYIGTGRVNAYKALADLNSDIDIDIRGGLRVKAIIRNKGSSDLTEIPWEIQVKGGILGLKNKTVNGTVDIPAGKSVRVHTGIFFGLGSIAINVKADIFEKTVTGKQRFIFTKIN